MGLLPATKKCTTLRMNTHETIRHRDHMRLGVLGIPEKGVRRPYLIHQVIVERYILHMLPRGVGIHEPWIVPLHAKVAVDSVLHINLTDLTDCVDVHINLDYDRLALLCKNHTQIRY